MANNKIESDALLSCGAPHFGRYIEKEFRAAFKKAAKAYGTEKIENAITDLQEGLCLFYCYVLYLHLSNEVLYFCSVEQCL